MRYGGLWRRQGLWRLRIMSEAVWGLTKGGVTQLPPFLQRIQAHNEAHNRMLLGARLVRALLVLWLRRHGQEATGG